MTSPAGSNSCIRDPRAEQPTSLLESVDSLRDMPMMPAVAIEAMQLADDPETSALDLARLIERDLTLATEILRVANSALYGFSNPADSVNRAVVRLGVKGCQNLVLVAGMSSLMRRFTLRQEWIREILWRHSVLTGMMCRQLNRLFQGGFHGEEFTAGLVHDIGRLVLAMVAEKQVRSADPFEFAEAANILQVERESLGVDHCQVGDLFARRNQLPESIREVIRSHHHPENTDRHQRLVTFVAAADHMANHYQRTFDPEQYDSSTNPALPLLLREHRSYNQTSLQELLPVVMEEAVGRCRDFCRS